MSSFPLVPFQADSNTQQFTPSFPPPVYYRDTFGLEPMDNHSQGDTFSIDSEESALTKSTIRHTIRIFHPNSSVPGPIINDLLMSPGDNNQSRRKSYGFPAAVAHEAMLQESQYSQHSTLPSTQMEELLITNQILPIVHFRALHILSAVLFGVALQMLIFSVVCIFFDGSWFGLGISTLELIISVILLLFVRYMHTRLLALFCILSTFVGSIFALVLFVITTYFIYNEDLRIRKIIGNGSSIDEESNQIVQNARMIMYSLLLIYAPICAIYTFSSMYLCILNWQANKKGQIRKGFFLSHTAGKQNVLVPIRIHQTNDDSAHKNLKNNMEDARSYGADKQSNDAAESVAVQTLNVTF